ncbi:F0F1 ATP synthase subunit delta [Halarcobacter bivalviorum]|uniref:ATP synthase subunit delta n=1 Tax=Halarcobacter bivalviorum TaxID=663364 RepID=A0AAX2A5C1_9BACT|nr:F0F1 ATP synthase subunit delta [Halarcobacter bivalviorum]AXH12947.1 ATP synthase, F1 complex, delta subunit [Halarcobacter bivalviorum]RXK09243.1 F0F1 ATP synthase subunit delta [Halarcobacter bivalviorum]
MNDLIAKRYVKALLDGRTVESATTICNDLKTISSAFAEEKFISIIASSEVKAENKIELVLSFLDNTSDELKNLVKLLGSKKRLDIIPDIASELESQVAKMNNSYTGVVYCNKELSADYISTIEKKFSEKFNVQLSLSQNVCDYDGIKVDIDSLGVEISFSKDRLKSQMIEHILKAV